MRCAPRTCSTRGRLQAKRVHAVERGRIATFPCRVEWLFPNNHPGLRFFVAEERFPRFHQVPTPKTVTIASAEKRREWAEGGGVLDLLCKVSTARGVTGCEVSAATAITPRSRSVLVRFQGWEFAWLLLALLR